jgi:hypothetical protein
MMGTQVGQSVLHVKKCQPPTEDELAEELGDAAENEIFRQIIEDKATNCLVINNLVSLLENHTPEDFKELEFDIQDEMVKYGTVIRTHVPRPPKYGDPYAQKGLGKAYVRYETVEQAEAAKAALVKRRLNDRPPEVSYYPPEKFLSNTFE